MADDDIIEDVEGLGTEEEFFPLGFEDGDEEGATSGAPTVGSYAKNLALTAKKGVEGLAKMFLPDAVELGKELKYAAEAGMQEATIAKDRYAGKLKKLTGGGDLKATVAQSKKEVIDDISKAVKTGDFRAQSGSGDPFADMMGDDMDFGGDMDFDSSPSEDTDSSMEAASISSKMNAGVAQEQTKQLAEVSAISDERDAVNSRQTDDLNVKLHHSKEATDTYRHNQGMGYVANIDENVKRIAAYFDTVGSRSAEAQMEFSEKSLALQQDTIKHLDEIRKSVYVAPKEDGYQEPKSKLASMFGFGLDGDGYGKGIAQNIGSMIENSPIGMMTGLADMMGDMDGMGTKETAGNRLMKLAAKTGAKQLLPAEARMKLERLNDKFTALPGMVNQNLVKAAAFSDNPLLRGMGKGLGIKDMVSTADSFGEKNLDAKATFSNRVSTSITDVIPGLLGKILAATSDSGEIYYDMEQGTFKTAESAVNKFEYQKELAYNSSYAANQFKDDFKAQANDFVQDMGGTEEEVDANKANANKDMETIFRNIANNTAGWDPALLHDNTRYRALITKDLVDPNSITLFEKFYEEVNDSKDDRELFKRGMVEANQSVSAWNKDGVTDMVKQQGGNTAVKDAIYKEQAELERYNVEVYNDPTKAGPEGSIARDMAEAKAFKSKEAIEMRTGGLVGTKVTAEKEAGIISKTTSTPVGVLKDIYELLLGGIFTFDGGEPSKSLISRMKLHKLNATEGKQTKEAKKKADKILMNELSASRRRTMDRTEEQSGMMSGALDNALASSPLEAIRNKVGGYADKFIDQVSGGMDTALYGKDSQGGTEQGGRISGSALARKAKRMDDAGKNLLASTGLGAPAEYIDFDAESAGEKKYRALTTKNAAHKEVEAPILSMDDEGTKMDLLKGLGGFLKSSVKNVGADYTGSTLDYSQLDTAYKERWLGDNKVDKGDNPEFNKLSNEIIDMTIPPKPKKKSKFGGGIGISGPSISTTKVDTKGITKHLVGIESKLGKVTDLLKSSDAILGINTKILKTLSTARPSSGTKVVSSKLDDSSITKAINSLEDTNAEFFRAVLDSKALSSMGLLADSLPGTMLNLNNVLAGMSKKKTKKAKGDKKKKALGKLKLPTLPGKGKFGKAAKAGGAKVAAGSKKLGKATAKATAKGAGKLVKGGAKLGGKVAGKTKDLAIDGAAKFFDKKKTKRDKRVLKRDKAKAKNQKVRAKLEAKGKLPVKTSFFDKFNKKDTEPKEKPATSPIGKVLKSLKGGLGKGAEVGGGLMKDLLASAGDISRDVGGSVSTGIGKVSESLAGFVDRMGHDTSHIEELEGQYSDNEALNYIAKDARSIHKLMGKGSFGGGAINSILGGVSKTLGSSLGTVAKAGEKLSKGTVGATSSISKNLSNTVATGVAGLTEADKAKEKASKLDPNRPIIIKEGDISKVPAKKGVTTPTKVDKPTTLKGKAQAKLSKAKQGLMTSKGLFKFTSKNSDNATKVVDKPVVGPVSKPKAVKVGKASKHSILDKFKPKPKKSKGKSKEVKKAHDKAKVAKVNEVQAKTKAISKPAAVIGATIGLPIVAAKGLIDRVKSSKKAKVVKAKTKTTISPSIVKPRKEKKLSGKFAGLMSGGKSKTTKTKQPREGSYQDLINDDNKEDIGNDRNALVSKMGAAVTALHTLIGVNKDGNKKIDGVGKAVKEGGDGGDGEGGGKSGKKKQSKAALIAKAGAVAATAATVAIGKKFYDKRQLDKKTGRDKFTKAEKLNDLARTSGSSKFGADGRRLTKSEQSSQSTSITKLRGGTVKALATGFGIRPKKVGLKGKLKKGMLGHVKDIFTDPEELLPKPKAKPVRGGILGKFDKLSNAKNGVLDKIGNAKAKVKGKAFGKLDKVTKGLAGKVKGGVDGIKKAALNKKNLARKKVFETKKLAKGKLLEKGKSLKGGFDKGMNAAKGNMDKFKTKMAKSKAAKSAAKIKNTAPIKKVSGSKFMTTIKSVLGKGMAKLKAKFKLPTKLTGAVDDLIKKVFSAKTLKNLLPKAGKLLAKLAGPIGIALVVADFVTGWSSTNRYFGLGAGAKPTLVMQFVSGLGNMLSSLTMGIIPADWIVTTAYKLIGKKNTKEFISGFHDFNVKKAAVLGVDAERLSEYETKNLWGNMGGAMFGSDKSDSKMLNFGSKEDDIEAFKHWKKDAYTPSEKIRKTLTAKYGKRIAGGVTKTPEEKAQQEQFRAEFLGSLKPVAKVAKDLQAKRAVETKAKEDKVKTGKPVAETEAGKLAKGGVAGSVMAKMKGKFNSVGKDGKKGEEDSVDSALETKDTSTGLPKVEDVVVYGSIADRVAAMSKAQLSGKDGSDPVMAKKLAKTPAVANSPAAMAAVTPPTKSVAEPIPEKSPVKVPEAPKVANPDPIAPAPQTDKVKGPSADTKVDDLRDKVAETKKLKPKSTQMDKLLSDKSSNSAAIKLGVASAPKVKDTTDKIEELSSAKPMIAKGAKPMASSKPMMEAKPLVGSPVTKGIEELSDNINTELGAMRALLRETESHNNISEKFMRDAIQMLGIIAETTVETSSLDRDRNKLMVDEIRASVDETYKADLKNKLARPSPEGDGYLSGGMGALKEKFSSLFGGGGGGGGRNEKVMPGKTKFTSELPVDAEQIKSGSLEVPTVSYKADSSSKSDGRKVDQDEKMALIQRTKASDLMAGGGEGSAEKVGDAQKMINHIKKYAVDKRWSSHELAVTNRIVTNDVVLGSSELWVPKIGTDGQRRGDTWRINRYDDGSVQYSIDNKELQGNAKFGTAEGGKLGNGDVILLSTQGAAPVEDNSGGGTTATAANAARVASGK